MPVIAWYMIAGGAGLAGLGIFTDKVGEGVNEVSNGFVKLAIAGGVTYVALKKAKVI